MRELLKERMTTKVEGWRGTDAAEEHLGLKAEVGHSNVVEVEVHWKGTGGGPDVSMLC